MATQSTGRLSAAKPAEVRERIQLQAAPVAAQKRAKTTHKACCPRMAQPPAHMIFAIIHCKSNTWNRKPATKKRQAARFGASSRVLTKSGHWWAFLQRKIDRYMHTRSADNRVVEVQLCNKGGTPIAKWMNIETGEISDAWQKRFTPMIQAEKDKRPVVVLAQQSLQFAYADRAAGIRNNQDTQRIQRGADIIEQYGQRILDDGAAAVFVGMHIYKISMEPEIGNERLALAELMRREPKGIFSGPDVWEPTSKQHPLAFDRDRVHPNYIGAEMMAHYWFATLLEHDGLEVPAWSRQEMEDAIANKPLGITRQRAAFAMIKIFGVVQ